MALTEASFLHPQWPVPTTVQALVTTRIGGVSRGAYASFNLGDHVGDDAAAVAANRALLRPHVPQEPMWLEQVHGTNVVDAATVQAKVRADGSFTDRSGVVCAVLTADCLPVLLCDHAGRGVAVVHAGWRGLLAGVIEQGIARFNGAALYAWPGPAIGSRAFEVGPEVRAQFIAHDHAAARAFAVGAGDRWWADLYALARMRLAYAGVTQVYGGDYCTVSDAQRFFSYRRDGACGRMASLIWLAE